MDSNYITYELSIPKKIIELLETYDYEMESDVNWTSVDDFIVQAIVEKFNNENILFSEIDYDGNFLETE